MLVYRNLISVAGFGYVDFKREDSAEVAVKKCKMGAVSVKDRVIAADFETSEPKGGFKGHGAVHGKDQAKKKAKKTLRGQSN